jgi:hypothetical protein
MAWTEEQINEIYLKTMEDGKGHCFFCWDVIEREIHGKDFCPKKIEGAWEIGHFISKADDGSDMLLNLVPACCECNNEIKDTDGFQYLKDKKKIRKKNGGPPFNSVSQIWFYLSGAMNEVITIKWKQ